MRCLLVICLLLLFGEPLLAQVPKPLFADDAPLSFTLAGRMLTINRDRAKPRADSLATRHPALLSYATGATDTLRLPVTLTVRGNFRREGGNCQFPPLYLNVPRKAVRKTLFEGQNKLKLVTHCQTDEYVVREYLVYRMFNLLSDLSFRARLARVTYVDSVKKKAPETHWGMLLEDVDDMAQRNHARVGKIRTKGQFVDSLTMATVAVFEYMVGNTDWSVPYQHNIRVLIDSTKKRPLVAPYDFDHAGIVDARYARPAEQLGIQSVRDRLYRGPAYPMALLNRVFARFNEQKAQLLGLYETNPYLNRDYVRVTLRYLDEFYEVINNPKYAARVFGANEAASIQIKGLK